MFTCICLYMFVCIRVFVCVRHIFLHLCIHAYMHICIYMCMFTFVCVCVCVCFCVGINILLTQGSIGNRIYMCMCVCVFTCVCLSVSLRQRACVYVCMYLCVCVCVCVCVCACVCASICYQIEAALQSAAKLSFPARVSFANFAWITVHRSILRKCCHLNQSNPICLSSVWIGFVCHRASEYFAQMLRSASNSCSTTRYWYVYRHDCVCVLMFVSGWKCLNTIQLEYI